MDEEGIDVAVTFGTPIARITDRSSMAMSVKEAAARENYDQRGNRAFEDQIAKRTAARDAEFLLPYVKAGMRLLDVGCGPGSITLGLASLVAPGDATGIDIQPDQVERARAAATEATVSNVRFDVADCYRLPFPDASFDICFANSVLQHLREPISALAEMRRVLRPGGFAAVRDIVTSSVIGPPSPLVEEFLALNFRSRRQNGGDPDVGLHHREYMLAAGFVRTQASASQETYGTVEETRRCASYAKTVWQGSSRTALAQGWVDQAKIDEIFSALEAWGERPDALSVMTRCNAIGWVD
jgi:ubiquinone/menaquinone biosynthesis C-methylase UbiE